MEHLTLIFSFLATPYMRGWFVEQVGASENQSLTEFLFSADRFKKYEKPEGSVHERAF